MADEVEDDIEVSLNLVENTMDRSGNMKKELKQIIYETVSTLRNLFVKLKRKMRSRLPKLKNWKHKPPNQQEHKDKQVTV
jgi:hypothetical protein